MITDELMFFDNMPRMLPLYEALREKLFDAYPGMEIRVSKTQISFRCRYGFAAAAVAVCGFEYGLRQLSALGLTSHREPVTGT